MLPRPSGASGCAYRVGVPAFAGTTMGARPPSCSLGTGFDGLRANGLGLTAGKLDGMVCAARIVLVCGGLAVSGCCGVAEAFAR